MNNTWKFENTNFLSLNNILLESEKNEFELREHISDPIEYMKVSMLGARRYLLNWPDEGLENAKKLYERMVLLDKVLKYMLFACVAWILFLKFSK